MSELEGIVFVRVDLKDLGKGEVLAVFVFDHSFEFLMDILEDASV
jgi:hypothetical protein